MIASCRHGASSTVQDHYMQNKNACQCSLLLVQGAETSQVITEAKTPGV